MTEVLKKLKRMQLLIKLKYPIAKFSMLITNTYRLNICRYRVVSCRNRQCHRLSMKVLCYIGTYLPNRYLYCIGIVHKLYLQINIHYSVRIIYLYLNIITSYD